MLVTVLILGILAAIAYPVYTKSVNKSRAVEAINLLEMVCSKQIAAFATTGTYLPNFTKIGQLTVNKIVEVKSSGDAILNIGKYELALNNANNCITAAYIPAQNKPATFTFSRSYEEAGLGCEGNVCKSFGDIVGDAKSVCNCGDKSCPDNYNLNEKTCDCDCPLACNQNGSCYNKTQNQATRKACGYNNSGTQTRTCTPDCKGGACGDWSVCTGQICDASTKPATSQSCASGCGTQTYVVTCNNGTWLTKILSDTCSSPTQTKPTMEGCESGCGTQTRTCLPSCDGGACGEWYTCQCPNGKDERGRCKDILGPIKEMCCCGCNNGAELRAIDGSCFSYNIGNQCQPKAELCACSMTM